MIKCSSTAESFFASLECELINRRSWKTRYDGQACRGEPARGRKSGEGYLNVSLAGRRTGAIDPKVPLNLTKTSHLDNSMAAVSAVICPRN